MSTIDAYVEAALRLLYWDALCAEAEARANATAVLGRLMKGPGWEEAREHYHEVSDHHSLAYADWDAMAKMLIKDGPAMRALKDRMEGRAPRRGLRAIEGGR